MDDFFSLDACSGPMCLMAVPNEHTFPHLATLGDCSIKTALRWLKTKHWIGKYIGMHPGMSLALATFTNHSPKLPYLSNCITLVKIFFWKHRVNFVHYVLLPTEQAETYLKIYYLTHILRWVVKKNNGYFTVRLIVSVYPPRPPLYSQLFVIFLVYFWPYIMIVCVLKWILHQKSPTTRIPNSSSLPLLLCHKTVR